MEIKPSTILVALMLAGKEDGVWWSRWRVVGEEG